jgi:N-acetylglucosamine malate deacetylase 1
MTSFTFDHLPPTDKPLDALVVAPHPDDAELGMGGTIAKLIELGWNIGIVDLTNGFRNRFLEPTLENRHRLASLFRLTKPRWIFAPYWEDAHPDHIAATQLVEAARFWSKLSKSDMAGTPHHPSRIYYYYCIHLKLAIQPAFVVDISQHWDKKQKSIASYVSQFITGREHIQPSMLDQLRDEASYWGKQIGTAYGEPFASREPIGMKTLGDLI